MNSLNSYLKENQKKDIKIDSTLNEGADHFRFDVYWENEKTAEVRVETTEVFINRIVLHPAKQIFAKDQMTRYELGRILKSRCWDEKRRDMSKLLSLIGVDEYNPYKICRKTHGCMVQDHIWFLYEDEHLTYEEVKGLT